MTRSTGWHPNLSCVQGVGWSPWRTPGPRGTPSSGTSRNPPCSWDQEETDWPIRSNHRKVTPPEDYQLTRRGGKGVISPTCQKAQTPDKWGLGKMTAQTGPSRYSFPKRRLTATTHVGKADVGEHFATRGESEDLFPRVASQTFRQGGDFVGAPGAPRSLLLVEPRLAEPILRQPMRPRPLFLSLPPMHPWRPFR